MGEQKRADHVSSSMNGCDDDDDDVPTNHGITTFFVFVCFFVCLFVVFFGGLDVVLFGWSWSFVCLFVCLLFFTASHFSFCIKSQIA